MDESTTTTEPVEESTAEQSQAEETTEEVAEDQETQDETEPEAADENIEWLIENKGLDPSDPEVLSKTAEMYRNAEKLMHQATKGASNQLKDAAVEAGNTGNEVMDRVQRLETELQVTKFYQKHPDAEALDSDLGALIESKPWLANDLEDAYTIIKSKQSQEAIKAAESKGRQQAKQEIARASTAGSPKGNASVPKADKTEDEARLERFSNW